MKIKVAIVGYLLFAWVGFFWGGVDWKVDNRVALFFYWAIVILSIVIGWLSFSLVKKDIYEGMGSDYLYDKKDVGWFWVACAGVFLYLKSLQMTGVSLFDGLSLMSNPAKENYVAMVRYSLERDSNPLLSLGVAFFAIPFWSALFYLFRFKAIKQRKIKIFVLLFLYFSFVLVKGADKEIFEIFVFFALFYYLDGRLSGGVKLLCASVASIAFLAFIAFRKLERSAEDICFYVYCLASDAATFEKAWSLILGYSAQGLKGLSVLLDGPFLVKPEPCVSPMVSSFAHRLLGLCKNNGAAIEYINSSGVWTSKGQWVSFPAWIASLGGLWIVPLIVLIHAFFFAYSLASRDRIKHDFWVFMFCFYSLIYFVYLPANNQVFLTADSALIFSVSYIYLVFGFARRLR